MHLEVTNGIFLFLFYLERTHKHTCLHARTHASTHTCLLMRCYKNFSFFSPLKNYRSFALASLLDGFFPPIIMESLPGHFFSLFFIWSNYRWRGKRCFFSSPLSFLFSFLPIFLSPACIQRSSHHCILIRDMSERLSAACGVL